MADARNVIFFLFAYNIRIGAVSMALIPCYIFFTILPLQSNN